MSSSLLIFGILAAALVLVAQRERLANTQTVLLEEARRALYDDHESLRARVFDHLHGTVQSELVVARVRLLDIARQLPDEKDAEAVRGVAAGIQRLHQLEVRRLAHVMVASGLETSLQDALSQLAASSEGLCEVRVRVSPEFEEIDRASSADEHAVLRLAMYRIVEEGISNAIRHGQANAVDVDIAARPVGRKRIVEIAVTNIGNLAQATAREGVGLRVMRARAAVFNGSVQTSAHDGRFRLVVRLEITD